MGYDVPEDLSDPEESRIEASKSSNAFIRSLVGCPLMHGTGMWLGAFLPLLLGGTAITTSQILVLIQINYGHRFKIKKQQIL